MQGGGAHSMAKIARPAPYPGTASGALFFTLGRRAGKPL